MSFSQRVLGIGASFAIVLMILPSLGALATVYPSQLAHTPLGSQTGRIVSGLTPRLDTVATQAKASGVDAPIVPKLLDNAMLSPSSPHPKFSGPTQLPAPSTQRQDSQAMLAPQTGTWGNNMTDLPETLAEPSTQDAAQARPSGLSWAHTFDGLNSFQAQVGHDINSPSDGEVATGNGYVVQVVNDALESWTTAGTKHSIFFPGGDGDSRILFDTQYNRWFLMGLGPIWFKNHIGRVVTTLDIDVSKTADPGGGWYSYTFNTTTQSNYYCDDVDQPTQGVDSTEYVVSLNCFNYSGGQWNIFDYIFGLNKADLVQNSINPGGCMDMLASTSPTSYNSNPDISIVPVGGMDSSSYLYMVGDGRGGSGIEVWKVAGTTIGCNGASAIDLRTITAFCGCNWLTGQLDSNNIPDAPEPYSTYTLQTDDGTIKTAYFEQSNGYIWLSAGDACQPTMFPLPPVQSCIRIVEIDPTSSDTHAPQGFDFPNTYTGIYAFYPSLAVNSNGDVVVVFGESSSSLFPSLAAAVISPNDLNEPSLGSVFQNSAFVVAQGQGVDVFQSCTGTACAWGDYFGAAPDLSNACSFWIEGTYGIPSTIDTYWNTAVASISCLDGSLTVSHQNADIGETVTFFLSLPNGECAASLFGVPIQSCRAHIDFGDGETGDIPCQTSSTLEITHSYSAGSPKAGIGSYIELYYGSSCNSFVGRAYVNTVQMTVESSPPAVSGFQLCRESVVGQVCFQTDAVADVDVGESILLSITNSPGSGGNVYTFVAGGTGFASCYYPYGKGTDAYECAVTEGASTGSWISASVVDSNGGGGASSYFYPLAGVYPQLIGNIGHGTLSGTAPLTVVFWGSASGGRASYYTYTWFFGDGATEVGQNVSHVFRSAGTFTVEMVVDDGVTAVPVSVQVLVSPSFSVGLSADPMHADWSPLSVTFSGVTTLSGGYTARLFFGDGNEVDSMSAVHSYGCSNINIGCIWTATLYVMSSSGETVSAIARITINSIIPASCVAKGTPVLTPSGWVDVEYLIPGETVVGYNTTANVQTDETVVSNVALLSTSVTKINNGTLVLDSFDQPIYVHNGTFTGWLLDPMDLVVGDDVFDVPHQTWVAVTQVTHSFNPTAVYDLQTTGLRDYVASGYLVLDHIGYLSEFSAFVSSTQTAIDQGVAVHFYGEASGNSTNGATDYTYSWNFGDGSSFVNVTSQNSSETSHAFLAQGSFIVLLRVTGPSGDVATASIIITVFPAISQPTLNASSTSMDAGQLLSMSVNVSGGMVPYTFNWIGLPSGCLNTLSVVVCHPLVAGTYSVTALVFDGLGVGVQSNTISITIQPDPAITSPSANPSSGHVDVGQTTLIVVTVTGGSGIYTFLWRGLPTGCLSVNVPVLACTPTGAGTFPIVVTVTDSNGWTVVSSTYNYTADSDPSVAAPTSNRASADVGQTLVLAASPTGGSGGYTFAWTGLPTGCSGSTASLSCTPSAFGTFSIYLTVTDSNGYSATSGYLSVVVWSDPILLTPIAHPYSVDVGQTLNFSVLTTGGSGGNTYSWPGLTSWCNIKSDPKEWRPPSYIMVNISCIPEIAGTFQVSVTMNDSNGYVTSSGILTYTVLTDPSVGAPSASRSTADVGQSVTFTVHPTGGLTPYSYVWTESSASFGCILNGSATITCTPTVLGVYTVTIKVTDSNGMPTNAVSSTNYTVYSDPTVTTPGAMPGSGHVDVGQTVSFETRTAGGSGGNVLAWFGLPTGCTSTSALSLSCNPTSSGTFTVFVTVTDSNGWTTASTVLNYTVYPDPTASTPVAFPLPSLVYEGLNLSTTASGGAPGGYTYLWAGLPPGCSSADAPTLACTPIVAGTYDVTVSVTDANNFTVTSPSLVLIVYLERVNISVSLVGTPGNAVNITILDNGVPMAWVVDKRTAGSPSVLTLDNIYLQAGHNYTLETTYVPSTGGSLHGKAHGANPVTLAVSYSGNANGTFMGYHVFNAAQPSTHVWDINLDQVTSFGGQQFMLSFGPVTVWVLENPDIGLVIIVEIINP